MRRRTTGRLTERKLPRKRDPVLLSRAQLWAVVQSYFEGLSRKDLSDVRWADNAILRVPIRRKLAKGVAYVGEGIPIVGKATILGFLSPILRHLGNVNVIQRSFEGNWVCTQTRVRFAAGPAVAFLVVDCFCIKKDRIVEHRIYFGRQRWA